MSDIFGTALDDYLSGDIDRINSIVGFSGNDDIFGGNQNDTVFGNSGDDFISGRNGHDTILAGRDNDWVSGGLDNDALFGNLGADSILGSFGNDTIFGGQGDDRLLGGEDNDRLSGDLGQDTLIGVDRFSVQPGLGEIDTLTGGEGADIFVLGNTSQSYYVGTGNSDFAVITDFQAGQDTIAVSNPNQVTLSSMTLDGYGAGMGIFETHSGINDLIAFLPGVTQSPNLYSFQSGYGLVDASAAVSRAVGQPNSFPNVFNSIANPWGVNRVNAPEVWAQGYTGQEVVVAVIDSGVDYTHPDLAGNIWNNPGEIANNGIDDDGNGYVDDVRGWDFVGNDNNPMDFDGHGTHVAGTIAAANNGFGVTGVAPNATIMPIRVLGFFGALQSDIADGIRYAADNGADVINLSLGGNYYSAETDAAIEYAIDRGVVVVMAAGNEGLSKPNYPAQLATDGGIAVGAIDYFNTMPDFSNGAGQLLDYVVAPAVTVQSTVPGNRYEFLDGTSFAAPHVSGVAALVLSANPNLTPSQVEEIIVQTANSNGIIA